MPQLQNHHKLYKQSFHNNLKQENNFRKNVTHRKNLLDDICAYVKGYIGDNLQKGD